MATGSWRISFVLMIGSTTPLGPLAGWSETLIATVNMALHSPFPTIVAWGPEMVFLYNDAGIPTLAGKHPQALGGFYRDVFREAWDLVKDDLAARPLTRRDPGAGTTCISQSF